ncbi:1-phosphofructokinase [Kineosphaera limosa NBRC 100340]|uniref:1-phosphofructokinase n=1 Tax=Kineosphaera limosa NBRC 100340 TaxID=1184609 RepID=K6VMR3_9MICO|nr:1-phosphofructokinase [Kineosphaera limosa NBRC 100340]
MPLTRGGVHRLADITSEPGGKGVNVARAVHLADQPVLAVLPAQRHDPILSALAERGVPYRHVEVPQTVRTNLTLTEADGTTTKLNEPGAVLGQEDAQALLDVLVGACRDASWAVLSGSLPPGAPPDWYAQLVRALRPLGVKIAVDTSDDPLRQLSDAFPDAAPDLLKPNSEELAQLTGADGEALEAAAAAGDPGPSIAAAAVLVERGVTTVMATLGGAGAVLVDAAGAWSALPPPIQVRSTVGAGDSSVAGYVMADIAGLDAAGRLAQAVAYGSGAASLAGSAIPTPAQTNPDAVQVTRRV